MKQISIPLSCSSCDGKMYSVRYDAPLGILKKLYKKQLTAEQILGFIKLVQTSK